MSIALDRLRSSLAAGGCTQLGIGPMSRACVDATIELANTSRVPLMLIASRRQIECEAQGGGYVNGWTTEAFAEYVRERDRGGYVVLCRDHGGPWQNYGEVKNRMQERDAMESAKHSFKVDIESGFDIVHIDPSIDIHASSPDPQVIRERLFELYDFCMETARENDSDIDVEIGTEEQSGAMQHLDVMLQLLESSQAFCVRRGYRSAQFIVAQTGTLVKETRNVGTLDEPFRRGGTVPAEIQVPLLVEACGRYGVCLKEHNADYLSNEALIWHPRLGIHATNIAPEFGVAETRHILQLCEEFGLSRCAEQFLSLAYDSRKWDKWMLPDTEATDRDRAVIAGHYVFATPEFLQIQEELRCETRRHGLDFDRSVRDVLKLAIMRIMACFNLCRR